MKKIIIVCISTVICVAIFAVPLYYQVFIKDNTTPITSPNATTPEPAAQKDNYVFIQNKYIVLDESESSYGSGAMVLNQETGDIYTVSVYNGELSVHKGNIGNYQKFR